jgi:AcrR family transcriptional regulator
LAQSNLTKEIRRVVSETKAHKDTFAVPELIEVLRHELENGDPTEDSREDTILLFVEKATSALASSPIYSSTLVRDLYRKVLDVADLFHIPRDNLLEDLLFQSLRRPAEPRTSKRGRQRNAKSRILRAALDEFSEKGFHAATIDSIAVRAGIAKGTVYRYFKTKHDLFNSLKDHTLSEFQEIARKDLEKEQDVVKIIDKVIRVYLSFFEQNSAFFKVIIQEHKDFGREFSEKFINELILALPGLKRRCWQASRRGRLKQMNYFTVFFGIVGFLNGVIQKWLHEGGEGSLLAEADTIKEVLFYGIVVERNVIDDEKPLKVIS